MIYTPLELHRRWKVRCIIDTEEIDIVGFPQLNRSLDRWSTECSLQTADVPTFEPYTSIDIDYSIDDGTNWIAFFDGFVIPNDTSVSTSTINRSINATDELYKLNRLQTSDITLDNTLFTDAIEDLLLDSGISSANINVSVSTDLTERLYLAPTKPIVLPSGNVIRQTLQKLLDFGRYTIYIDGDGIVQLVKYSEIPQPSGIITFSDTDPTSEQYGYMSSRTQYPLQSLAIRKMLIKGDSKLKVQGAWEATDASLANGQEQSRTNSLCQTTEQCQELAQDIGEDVARFPQYFDVEMPFDSDLAIRDTINIIADKMLDNSATSIPAKIIDIGTKLPDMSVTLSVTPRVEGDMYDPFAAPTDLTATADGSYTIDLTWEYNSDTEEGFIIRDDDMFEVEVGTGVTSYSVTGLDMGSYRCYTVVALIGGYETNPSNEACAITNSVSPRNFNVTPTNWYGFNMTWEDDLSTETGFYLYEDISDIVLEVPANTTSYSYTEDITVGAYYCWEIAYKFEDGSLSPFSDRVCAKTHSPDALYSTDGQTWLSNDVDISQTISVAYGDGKFVAMGNPNCHTSTDGITWTTRSTIIDRPFENLKYAGGLFLAFTWFLKNPEVVVSTDGGITWGIHSIGEDYSCFIGCAYGNGLYVTLDSHTPNVYTSSDGINWTKGDRLYIIHELRDIIYANGMFVITAYDNYGTDTIATSTDGTNWTTSTGISGYWRKIAYGNGLFVVIAFDRVMTSPDAINWTERTCPQYNWRQIAYGNGLFVAVAYERVMVSSDGINWTDYPIPSHYYDIAYGDGKFVITT